MNSVFFGTPEIAVPFLRCLAQRATITSVVSAPDQPAGRGYSLKAPEVKTAALELGLPVQQPLKASDPAFVSALKALSPDVCVVVAYGKLLPKSVLECAKFGFLNVHFSLLPAYRGAAPIQWALINGETQTGVTLFWLDEGMDTGPLFLQRSLSVGSADANALRNKLVELGVEMLGEAIDLLKQGKKSATPQTGASSKAPILQKEDGRLDWTQPAVALSNRIRGTTPWPGAFTGVPHAGSTLRLKVIEAKPLSESTGKGPGTIVRADEPHGIAIMCGQGVLELIRVQPEGKKPMSAWSWWQGARLSIGDRMVTI